MRIHKLKKQLEEKRKQHVEKKDTSGNNSNVNQGMQKMQIKEIFNQPDYTRAFLQF